MKNNEVRKSIDKAYLEHFLDNLFNPDEKELYHQTTPEQRFRSFFQKYIFNNPTLSSEDIKDLNNYLEETISKRKSLEHNDESKKQCKSLINKIFDTKS